MQNYPPGFEEGWFHRADRRERIAQGLRSWGDRLGPNGKAAGWAALVLAVIALAGSALWITSRGSQDSSALPTTTTRTTYSRPLAIPTAPRVDLANPFAGTPAAGWQQGAAGLVMPPAAPIDRYSTGQVQAALDRAKELITAARLDRHVLETGDAEPVLALVAPLYADHLREKLTPGNESETWWITAKIAPVARLLAAEPRVNGNSTIALNDRGELTIKTNYIVAYAFDVLNASTVRAPMEIIVVVRQETDYVWVDDESYNAASQGMWIEGVRSFTYAGNCTWYKKGYLAPSYGETPSTGKPVRPESQYFDPSIPIPTENDC